MSEMRYDKVYPRPSIHSRTRRCADCGDTIYRDDLGQWRHFETHLMICDDAESRWADPRS